MPLIASHEASIKAGYAGRGEATTANPAQLTHPVNSSPSNRQNFGMGFSRLLASSDNGFWSHSVCIVAIIFGLRLNR